MGTLSALSPFIFDNFTISRKYIQCLPLTTFTSFALFCLAFECFRPDTKYVQRRITNNKLVLHLLLILSIKEVYFAFALSNALLSAGGQRRRLLPIIFNTFPIYQRFVRDIEKRITLKRSSGLPSAREARSIVVMYDRKQ